MPDERNDSTESTEGDVHPTPASIACVAAGLMLVLLAVEQIAGIPWAALVLGVVLIYAGYVISTNTVPR